MSFVGNPFLHDVFVSYSHGDLEGDGNSPLKLWSQSFVEELRRELQFEIDSAISLFLDESDRSTETGLDRMAPVEEELKRNAESAAVLLILMTPHYLRSNWCSRERDWWAESGNGEFLKNEKRVAIARVLPTKDTSWPSPLSSKEGNHLIGEFFYDRARSDAARPFGWPKVTNDTDGEFRNSVVRLSGLLNRRLKELREIIEVQRKKEKARHRLKAESGHAIYLFARDDQISSWERARESLLDAGFAVLPIAPDPVPRDPREIRAASNKRIGIMQTCDAVLLVGGEDDASLVEDFPSVARFDRHQAIALSNRPLPCGVLYFGDAGDQNSIVQRIAANLKLRWIDASISTWSDSVKTWLIEHEG